MRIAGWCVFRCNAGSGVRRTVLKYVLFLMGLSLGAALADTNAMNRSNEDRYLLRFEWANDILVGTDNGFSANWGISWHSRAMESWDEASSFSQWVGRTVPGLGTSADDDQKVKVGYGLNQLIQTPTDLTDPDLIPNDVPYAGVLGVYASWYRLNNNKLRAFQIYGGILGPSSYAEEMQKFIHNDLDMGTDPQGWDNQLYNQLLLNLNYEINQKIWTWGEQAVRSFSTDLALGGGGGLGNYFTGLSLQGEWRFGWGLPQGFTTMLEGSGRGIGMNPVIDVPYDKWSLHFSFIPRISALGYFALYEGRAFEDHPHPGVDFNNFPVALNYGVHFSKKRFSFHWTATYHPYDIVDNGLGTDTGFGTLAIEYLF